MELMGKVFQKLEYSARNIANALLPPFHKTISEEQWVTFIQFIKFGLVGLANTLITYLVYILFIELGVHPLVANAIGYVVGILNSFYWNNKYVFKENGSGRSLMSALMKCFASYLGSFLLSTVLLFIWTDLLSISDYIAPLITLVITIPLNFIMNKFWAFRSK